MAENKTKPTAASVEMFLNTVKDEQQREDSFTLLEMMKKASKEEPARSLSTRYISRWSKVNIGLGYP